jgi:hypothetical protein
MSRKMLRRKMLRRKVLRRKVLRRVLGRLCSQLPLLIPRQSRRSSP